MRAAALFLALSTLVVGFSPAALYGFDPPACFIKPFDDVEIAHEFCPWIRQLRLHGITLGCGGGNYCPDNPVTRAQAAFLIENFYQRTLVVRPFGDPSANGGALLLALAAISDNAADKPYLLKLEPGIYDVGGELLTLKPWVDVEGSGEGVTTIRGTVETNQSGVVFVPALPAGATIELRFLTVAAHNAGALEGYAIQALGNLRLSHVTARNESAGGLAGGILGSGAAFLWLRNVEAYASVVDMQADAVAIKSTGIGSSMTDLSVEAFALAGDATGILNSSGATITNADVTAESRGAGTSAIAIDNSANNTTVQGGRVTAIGCCAVGLANSSEELTVDSVQAESSWRAMTSPGGLRLRNVTALGGEVGVYLSSGVGLTNWIDGSRIRGGTAAAVFLEALAVLKLSTSQLEGGKDGTGSITCIGAFDENYGPLSSTCT